jgi:hypothetical protein
MPKILCEAICEGDRIIFVDNDCAYTFRGPEPLNDYNHFLEDLDFYDGQYVDKFVRLWFGVEVRQ